MFPSRRSDAGVSLVELLIYMLLAVVVLTMIAAILINSLRAESTVRASAEATSTAQLVAQSLNRGVHNASALEVVDSGSQRHSASHPSIDSSSAGAWKCQAWAVVEGEFRTTTSNTAIVPPSTAAEVADWLLLANEAKTIGANPIFSIAADERSLSVAFTVGSASGVPVTLDTTIVSKQPIPSTGKVTTPCF